MAAHIATAACAFSATALSVALLAPPLEGSDREAVNIPPFVVRAARRSPQSGIE